jgi:RNA-binding protein 8A
VSTQGYALIEYETYDEAKAAIEGASGSELLGQELKVDWAFVRGAEGGSGGGRGRTNVRDRISRN